MNISQTRNLLSQQRTYPQTSDLSNDPLSSIQSHEFDSEKDPVYCLCKKGEFGTIVLCDNVDCLIKWFHFPCVGLGKASSKQELVRCQL